MLSISTALYYQAKVARQVEINGKQRLIATWIGYGAVNRYLYQLNEQNIEYRVYRMGSMTTIVV